MQRPSNIHHLPPTHPAARHRPKSPNRVLAEQEAQWLFTDAELANTPSIQDGMTQADEKDLRAKGVNFIVQVGILLKLPQLTLSTAAIFFQRFLMRASLKSARGDIPKLHHFQSAATALFLATKVEESCRKMKEIVLACCRVAQKNPNLVIDEQSKDFWRWRDCILYNEDVLLETLCFDLTVESPHRQLFDMLKGYGMEHNKRLRNAAWAFVTDSVNTQLCLLYNSRTIAVAAFYNACKYCEVQLPDDVKGRPWWEAMHVRLPEVRRTVEYMAVHFEQMSQKSSASALAGSGAPSSEGGRSIYVGLSTPNDQQDDWDVTRLKEDRQDMPTGSPFPASQGQQRLAPGSERRLSNASSAGQKRDREDPAPATTHDASTNGTNGEIPLPKRPKTDDEPDSNTLPTSASQLGKQDPLHEEERLRVQNGDLKSAADVKNTPDAKEDPAEGSEEGEVEE
jgi:protein BUR2